MLVPLLALWLVALLQSFHFFSPLLFLTASFLFYYFFFTAAAHESVAVHYSSAATRGAVRCGFGPDLVSTRLGPADREPRKMAILLDGSLASRPFAPGAERRGGEEEGGFCRVDGHGEEKRDLIAKPCVNDWFCRRLREKVCALSAPLPAASGRQLSSTFQAC